MAAELHGNNSFFMFYDLFRVPTRLKTEAELLMDWDYTYSPYVYRL